MRGVNAFKRFLNNAISHYSYKHLYKLSKLQLFFFKRFSISFLCHLSICCISLFFFSLIRTNPTVSFGSSVSVSQLLPHLELCLCGEWSGYRFFVVVVHLIFQQFLFQDRSTVVVEPGVVLHPPVSSHSVYITDYNLTSCFSRSICQVTGSSCCAGIVVEWDFPRTHFAFPCGLYLDVPQWDYSLSDVHESSLLMFIYRKKE